MVKKISVFIMILGLFFVGIPQPKVKAQNPSTTTIARFFLNNNSWTVEGTEGSNYYTVLNDIKNNAVLVIRVEWQELWYDHIATYQLIENDTVIVVNINWQENENNFNADYFIYSDGTYYLSYLAESYTYMPPIYFTFLGEAELTYYDGYNDGFREGKNQGYDNGYNDGLINGINQGYDNGYQQGYQAGLNETDATGFNSLLITVFGGLGALLGIEILPGIYIGAIIAVPLVFGIIFFILGKRKGD